MIKDDKKIHMLDLKCERTFVIKCLKFIKFPCQMQLSTYVENGEICEINSLITKKH